MYKIIGTDGQPYGPVNAEQIKHWILEGRARAETLVQAEGALEWKPLISFSELAAGLQPPIAPVPPGIGPVPSALAVRASKKIPAGICGILLGWLGIHKFILGYTGPGVIMLVVSLVGFVCGGSLVMWVFGLIEGIVYLTKSDEEFVRTYVDGRKEWF